MTPREYIVVFASKDNKPISVGHDEATKDDIIDGFRLRELQRRGSN